MDRVQIQLVETNEGYLDLAKGTNVPTTYAVSDIRNVSKREGSGTKTLKLADTPNNNTLLNNYFDVNVIDGTFNKNILQKCILIEDGVTILDNAYLQLKKVTKTQLTPNHDQYVEYEVVIKDSTSDFFTKINNLELTDLDFETTDTFHLYNSQNIVDSFSHSSTDVYKYIMPNKTTGNQYQLGEWMPGIYCLEYWDKIFFNAGYEYEWVGLTASDTRFDKLIIPFNGGQSELTEEYIEEFEVIAEASSSNDYTYPYAGDGYYLSQGSVTPLIVDLETKDGTNAYNPTASEYTNVFDLSGANSLNYEIDIDYDIIIDNIGAVPVVQGLLGFVLQTSIKVGVGTFLPNLGVNLLASTSYPVGETLIGNVQATGILSTAVSSGDMLQLELHLNQVGTSEFTPGTFNYIIRVNSIDIRIVPNAETLGHNFPVLLNSFIPKKIKQNDFIKSIAKLYNLYFEIDEFNPNKLTIKNRDRYYDEGKINDWTDKLNKNMPQNIIFLPELSSKKLTLTYKEDTSDEVSKAYIQNTNEIYGQLEFTYDNEYTRGNDIQDVIFSSTVMTETNFGAVVPTITGATPMNNIRILYDGGNFPCSEFDILDFSASGQLGLTDYPLYSHFDSPKNPTFDINFGQCDYYSLLGLQVTNNNLWNLHWRRTVHQINESKMFIAHFDLDAASIYKMKLSDKIRIDNSWWNINRVVDRNSGFGTPTVVELLSVDDELELSPFQETDNIFTDTGIYDEPIRNLGNSLDINYNNNNGNTGVLDGINNTISTAVSNGIYSGKNNIIESNSFIIGSNNRINGPYVNTAIIAGTGGNTISHNNNIMIGSGGLTSSGDNIIYLGNEAYVDIINGDIFTTGIITGSFSVSVDWSDTLAIGNNSGANDVIMDATQVIKGQNGDTSIDLQGFGGVGNISINSTNGTETGNLFMDETYVELSQGSTGLTGYNGIILSNSEISIGTADDITTSASNLMILNNDQSVVGITSEQYSTLIGTRENLPNQVHQGLLVGNSTYALTSPSLTSTESTTNSILSAARSTIAADSFGCVILGGKINSILNSGTMSVYYSSTTGGSDNTIDTSDNSSITGSIGCAVTRSTNCNITSSDNSIVWQSDNSIVSGGSFNDVYTSVDSGIIEGGANDITSGTNSVIIGGALHNINTSTDTVIVGGVDSTITDSNGSFIGGGFQNSITATDTNNVIIGGDGGSISGSTGDSIILGGSGNSNVKDRTVISGGQNITSAIVDATYTGDFVITKQHAIPSSTSDSVGDTGSITWDTSYLYVKTSGGTGAGGWKRTALSTF